MSVTHNQKIQARKKKDRELRNRKIRNINRNLPSIKYRLDVSQIETKDGVTKIGDFWTQGVKFFRSLQAVQAYKEEVEADRSAGKEILPGRIVSAAGKIIFEIPGSNLTFKGSAPDKILDGPKADPDVKA